ncbi:MAG: phage holin family protein [Myxococcales bacterium]
MAEFEGRSAEGMPTSSPASRSPDSVTEAVSGLSQGMNALVRGHLALARVEVVRDLKALGKDTSLEMAGVPMLLASYLLLWIGIGYALALAIPTWASFLICSAANLLVGLALMAYGYARMKSKKEQKKLALPATAQEVRRDREWAAQLKEETALARRELH